jgi:hypothetical protein
MQTLNNETKRLQQIEDISFNAGNTLMQSFDSTKSISTLKAAVSVYRLSIQAMRYKIVHKVVTVPKKRK